MRKSADISGQVDPKIISFDLNEPTVPISHLKLQTCAEWSLIPSIIISTVISNQLSWSFGQTFARLIGWMTLLSASVIVTSHFRGKLWPMILVTLVPISKIFQGPTGTPDEGLKLSYYIVLYGALISLSGSIMITSRFNLVYKQLYYICLLNILFMFMQVAGIADWSQFATTHAESIIDTYPIAFFNRTDVFDISQLRPAGLLYANQYLSMIALFGLVLHFSRKSEGFKSGTIVVCTMAVLAMAKLVFLGLILISLFIIIAGNKYQRRSMLKGITITLLLIYLYKLFFPGLFEANLNSAQIIYSASTRISNILYKQGNEDALSTLRLMADEYKNEDIHMKILMSSELEEDLQISGYEDLIEILPQFIIALLIIIPFYIWGYLKVRQRFQDLTILIITSSIIAIIIPSAGPLWGSPMYLFICGFAFLPLFFPLLKPVVNVKNA